MGRAIKTVFDFLQHIRFSMSKQREPYFLFREILGFYPKNIELYQLALRHKSSSIRRDNGVLLNNERLEFLGDAVLDVLVADLLFHHFESEGEGFLTNTRSKIVQRATLNKIALELGLDKLIVAAVNTSSPRESIFGNTLEALIGAIYLDRGYRVCKQFLEKKIIERFLDIEGIAKKEINFKSRLLEWSQHYKITLNFKTWEREDSPSKHSPIFECDAYLGNICVANGQGYSKKMAQQQASEKALNKLEKDKNFQQEVLQQASSPLLPPPSSSLKIEA